MYNPDSSNGINIAIIGGNGNAAKMLVEELIHASFAISHIRLLGNPIRGLQRLKIDDFEFPIHSMKEEVIDNPQLEGIHIVILATPPAINHQLAKELRSEGLPCIDLNAMSSEFGWTLSDMQVDLDVFREHRYWALPSPQTTICARVMAPLIQMGASVLRATTLLSASVAGKKGLLELSQQVTALFNSRPPTRQIFEDGLAFDILSAWGVERDGWTHTETVSALELAHIFGTHPSRFVNTVNVVPTFSGISSSIHISFDKAVTLEGVVNALSTSQYLSYENKVSGPQHWMGQNSIGVGRLRLDPLGDGVHLWATADELRALMSRNVIELIKLIIEEDLL